MTPDASKYLLKLLSYSICTHFSTIIELLSLYSSIIRSKLNVLHLTVKNHSNNKNSVDFRNLALKTVTPMSFY